MFLRHLYYRMQLCLDIMLVSMVMKFQKAMEAKFLWRALVEYYLVYNHEIVLCGFLLYCSLFSNLIYIVDVSIA